MDKTQKITEHLRKKYHPEAIILHGSRARGQERDNSDWDMYVLVRNKAEGGTEVFDDESLDVHVIVLPVCSEKLIATFGSSLMVSQVLLDSQGGVAQRLLETMQKLYAQGKKLTEREHLNRKNMMFRTLQRLKGYVSYPEAFFLHAGWFYEQALNYWFTVKGEWSKPVYEALPIIKEKDPDYYNCLETLASNNSAPEKLARAEKIYSVLFR